MKKLDSSALTRKKTSDFSGTAIVRPRSSSGSDITFLWKPNEVLAEMVYTADHGIRFAVKKDAAIEIADTVEGRRPVEWLQGIVHHGSLHLPSEPMPYGSLGALAKAMRVFIQRYFDCEERFLSVMVLYALCTWIYERFHSVPYLRFLGISGSGKSRGSEVMAKICYHGLLIAGATSIPALFRQIEVLGGTLVLDEADFDQSQIGSEIAKVLNSGFQKGMPVVRNDKDKDGNWVPRHFDVFGPKILNGRRAFKDDATENRCLTYTPRPTQRRDIPKQLPPAFEAEALEIRNMALMWRFDTLDRFEPQEIPFDGVRPRMEQILAPLLNIASLLEGEMAAEYREQLASFAKDLDQQQKDDQKGTVEAMLIKAFVDHSGSKRPTCKDLVMLVKEDDNEEDPTLDKWLSPRAASTILRGLGFSTHHTNHGSEVSVDPDRLADLMARYAIVKSEGPRRPRFAPAA